MQVFGYHTRKLYRLPSIAYAAVPLDIEFAEIRNFNFNDGFKKILDASDIQIGSS